MIYLKKFKSTAKILKKLLMIIFAICSHNVKAGKKTTLQPADFDDFKKIVVQKSTEVARAELNKYSLRLISEEDLNSLFTRALKVSSKKSSLIVKAVLQSPNANLDTLLRIAKKTKAKACLSRHSGMSRHDKRKYKDAANAIKLIIEKKKTLDQPQEKEQEESPLATNSSREREQEIPHVVATLVESDKYQAEVDRYQAEDCNHQEKRIKTTQQRQKERAERRKKKQKRQQEVVCATARVVASATGSAKNEAGDAFTVKLKEQEDEEIDAFAMKLREEWETKQDKKWMLRQASLMGLYPGDYLKKRTKRKAVTKWDNRKKRPRTKIEHLIELIAAGATESTLEKLKETANNQEYINTAQSLLKNKQKNQRESERKTKEAMIKRYKNAGATPETIHRLKNR